MKRSLLFSFLVLLGCMAKAQTNIALTATANHTVGGATTYGPQNYNDGIITAAPATTPWGWTNTNGFIEYTWTTVQTGITKVKFWKADRPMGSCTIQYWNGSSYVTVQNYTTSTSTYVDSVVFTVPITTTKLKFDNVAGSSNPNHREIEVFAGPPCFGPTSLAVNSILSTSASASWAGVSGSVGYEYLVTTTPTPIWPYTTTGTTSTSASLTGLTPGTNYYLHVLNKCSSNNYSGFVSYPFTTLPPCKPPVKFKTVNLLPTSATISWDAWLSASSYDYLVDQNRNDPTSSTSMTNTAATSANITGLTENTKYYVHIRSNCFGNEMSGWSLDSFTTPIPCRAPVINIDHVNTTQAVAYWADVPTALSYEYALTKTNTPPAIGTKYNYTSIHTAALDNGQFYYIHVRCKCNSIGVEAISPWGTSSFKTFPTAVNNIDNKQIGISAYPNPVKDVLTVAIEGNRDGSAVLMITDLAGKVVQTENVLDEKTEINMAALPAGSYLLRYKDQSNMQVIKISKQ